MGDIQEKGTSGKLMRSVIYADHKRPPLSLKDGCRRMDPAIKPLLPEVPSDVLQIYIRPGEFPSLRYEPSSRGFLSKGTCGFRCMALMSRYREWGSSQAG